MFAWLIWSIRLFASSIMLLTALACGIVAATGGDKGRTAVLVTAAVFGVGGLFSWPRRPNAWRYDPPTDRQLAYAQALGITVPRGVSKGELSDMISQVTGR
jgi:hypothetical protein